MNGRLPDWIQRSLGLPSRPGEGVQWTLEHAWPWPAWVSILLIGVLVGVILAVYWRENRSASRRFRMALAGLRLLLIGILFGMIAQITLVLHRTGLPYLAVLVDNSGSMGATDSYEKSLSQSLRRRLRQAGLEESNLSRLNLAKLLLLENESAWLKRLQQGYQLRVYVLEDSLAGARALEERDAAELEEQLRRLQAETPSTRLGSAVQTIFRDLRGVHPTAILLLTDGITTEGPPLSESANLARRRGTPLWIVGLGDARQVPNMKLADVLVEPVVFVEDWTPFECSVVATGLEGRRARLTLSEEGKREILAQTDVVLGPDGVVQTVRLLYRPTQEGTFRYQLQLQPLEEELTHEDNQRTCLVQVRKEQIHVLLAQTQPDYEFRYLSNLLRRDRTIQLHTWLQEADPEYIEQTPDALRSFPIRREELFAYDVIILGEVSPSALGSAAMEMLVDFVQQPSKGGALVLIAGPRGWMPQAFRGTPLERLLPFDLSAVRLPEPEQSLQEGFVVEPTELGLLSPSMQLAETMEETRQMWRRLPPIYWFLQIHQVHPGVRVLAQHPTQTTASGTRMPIILMQYVGAGQVLFHATEETWRWRWRLGDALFARYWIQTLRTLSRAKLAQGARWAELSTDRREYQRGEPVRVRVVFADPRQAPEDDRGVTVVVEPREGTTQRITLQRTPVGRGVFETVLPSLPLGEYHVWLSQPTQEGLPPSADFRVVAPPGEMARLQMDAAELRRAAQASQGRFASLAEADALFQALPQGRQVPLETLPPMALWNRWPVLALFLLLLIAEWLLRKSRAMV